MTAPLHTHPPLEIAIGPLPQHEQSHIQVAMRMLCPQLEAPCTVVLKDAADITLAPGAEPAFVSARSLHAAVQIERPVRLVPLFDALSQLIRGILAARSANMQHLHDAAPPASAHGDGAMGGAGPSLLHILLARRLAAPVMIRLRSGRGVLVDGHYARAYLPEPAAGMLASLHGDPVACITAVSPADFSRRIATDHPVTVEQLCWALPAEGQSATVLSDWHKDADARIRLDSWPNLSLQHDSQAWLRVLSRLARSSATLGQLRRAALEAGIPADRARHGLSLLLAYGHARVIASGELLPVLADSAPRPTAPSSLIARLRSRLRALAA